MQALTSVDIAGLRVFSKGKVRTVYDLGEQLLIVASDRVSAFDYVLGSGIPDKGKILTAISAFWFRKLAKVSAHHMITTDVARFPLETRAYAELLRDRSMLVRKAKRIDLECIVRGHLAGSAWKEYQATGKVAGINLPGGLALNARLEQPIFTPSTKSDQGHDRNIAIEEMFEIVGLEPGEIIRRRSLAIFDTARRLAEAKGVTIVDTKFEFGYLDGEIVLIDEIFTPDSSRFLYREAGAGEPINVDKQFIRDYLEQIDWNKTPPVPELPAAIVAEARRRYLVILERVTGERPAWAT
ncbi:MAG TPA: phosphoribosylaminoimidazolesuccinocarboxamide synthase [bacterium]|nr:phosphoribosylaminoimidazolesuccinocarboxamide synthase [bacterium]